MEMQKSAEQSSPEKQASGRRVLLFLLIFFSVPLVLVLLMHRYGWQPEGKSHGELISPARPLQAQGALFDAQGREINPGLWRGKWSMVYIADECDAVCRTRLHDMRQLHASLAKDIERVQRVLISGSNEVSGIQKTYPDLIVISRPPDALSVFIRQFDVGGSPVEKANRVYLVDPMGNLMMNFPGNLPAREIRKDLGRLLRYSWAG